MAIKGLKNFTASLSAQLEIMENRNKQDIQTLVGEVITIRDYGFLKGDDGEFVCFIIDGYDNDFFFGGTVLTEQLKAIEEGGYHDEVVADGLPTLLGTKKSKNKREYMTVKFYPEG